MNIITSWNNTALWKRNMLELSFAIVIGICFGWPAVLLTFLINLLFNIICFIYGTQKGGTSN